MSVEDIEALVRLRDSGAISEEEYQEQKTIALKGPRRSIGPVSMRLLVAVILALTALFAVWYFGSPRWTLYQLRVAIEDQDADQIASFVDFSELRENLKDRFNAEMTKEAIDNDNPFAMLGAGLADGMIDRFVTKQNIVQMINRDFAQREDVSMTDQFDFERLDFDHFRLTHRGGGTIYFARDGLSWRLVDLDASDRLDPNPPNSEAPQVAAAQGERSVAYPNPPESDGSSQSVETSCLAYWYSETDEISTEPADNVLYIQMELGSQPVTLHGDQNPYEMRDTDTGQRVGQISCANYEATMTFNDGSTVNLVIGD